MLSRMMFLNLLYLILQVVITDLLRGPPRYSVLSWLGLLLNQLRWHLIVEVLIVGVLLLR
jgi:hypothetical protein